MLAHPLGALGAEPAPIDHAQILRQAKAPWPHVPRLRPRRHAPDLHEREVHFEQPRHGCPVLVELGGQADRAGEPQHPRARVERHHHVDPVAAGAGVLPAQLRGMGVPDDSHTAGSATVVEAVGRDGAVDGPLSWAKLWRI